MPDAPASLPQADILLEQLPDAAVFASTDGIIQTWNEAAERLFGWSAAEAIGKDLNVMIPESFRDRHWTGFDRALSAGETKYRGQSLPTRSLTASGKEIYVELGFAIVKDGSGEVVGALATARDITERFERDRELRREIRALKGEGTART